MKLSLPFLVLLIAGQAQAGRTLFTPLQERKVLEAVQEACNNTWCEGDFGYDFQKFHCEKSSCRLEFDIIVYGKYDEVGIPDLNSAVKHPQSCDYAPVRRLSDVLNREKNYVSSKYFLALANCIDEKAGSVEGDKNTEPRPPEPKPEIPLPIEVNRVQPAPQFPTEFNAAFPNFK